MSLTCLESAASELLSTTTASSSTFENGEATGGGTTRGNCYLAWQHWAKQLTLFLLDSTTFGVTTLIGTLGPNVFWPYVLRS